MIIRRRPESVREVARRVHADEQDFDAAVLEFLDSFYTHTASRESAIRDAPERIDGLRDAYLSAVAEHLALLCGLQVPAWTELQGHDLHEPYFAGGLESLKGVLLAESPTAFRRRLLFVSKDALSRPRMLQSDYGSSSVSQ
jgi:hypothetical protein